MKLRDFTYSPVWNIILITIGSVLFSLGVKSIVVHHNFITGGIYGTGLLIYYKTNALTPGMWFLLLNLPLFIIGWFFVSKRFFFYSIYSVVLVTVSSELINFNFNISQQLYAAIAGGIICGTGTGIVLRSLGSGGGLDIIGVILNQKFNIGIGKFYLLFNFILFIFVVSYFGIDIFIASIILVFISSTSLEYVLALFNQRKIIYVISDKNEEIANILIQDLNQGATFIKARGAYTGKNKYILMAITNNIQLKRVEEAVFKVDSHALFIVENSFNVIGSTFSKRKIY
ncbi:MAG: YitT family protein [Desulfobacterales bacterium]|nr:YitT family protein [Desulfobacterales bacterium]